VAYDPSDFGQNSPEESAAGIANAIASSRGEAQTYTTKDFQDDSRDAGPAPVYDKRTQPSSNDANSNGILGVFQKMIGYKPNLSMSKNMYNMMVPGQNTPFGGLTYFTPALGISRAAQLGFSLANRGIGELIGPAKTQAEIDATPVYDMRTQPPGPPTNMGIESGYQGAGLPSISMQSLPQLYGDNFYE